MKYIDIENYFESSRHLPFINFCLSPIANIYKEINIDDNLFELCDKLVNNEDLDFYIELNNFFNSCKPNTYGIENITVVAKVLLSISASINLIISNINNIPISFFLIHSSIDYNVTLEIPHASHNNFQNILIGLLESWTSKMIPDNIAAILSTFLTYSVFYAKKYSTDYHLVNDLIYNIQQVPNLLNSITNEIFSPLLCQFVDWCFDNKHDDLEVLYKTLDTLEKSLSNPNSKIQIEFCLYRYRDIFEQDYDYNHLVDFYNNNQQNIDLINKLRILSQLFIKHDRNKYINLFSKEISELDQNTLIRLVEETNQNVFSAYIINLSYYYYDNFLDFIETTYDCSKDIFKNTQFYIPSNDVTYIFGKDINKYPVKDPDLHYNIIQCINYINQLGITVFGESIEQELPEIYSPSKDNKPKDQHKFEEKKLIDYLEQYYFINENTIADEIKYILPMQHIRVPLQQLLLKKYNKLYPLVKIVNKEFIDEKKVEKIIHIVLSKSGTLDQEKEAIEFLNKLSANIEFEYLYTESLEELLGILSSDDYSVISITSHGEINSREPLYNRLKIGDIYIPWYMITPDIYPKNAQRLVYLNVCDSGHFSLKNGFIYESFSTFLTTPYQATVSHMWPVNQTYSSTVLMIFYHHLSSGFNSFKEAYLKTMTLSINNKLDEYIDLNKLSNIELFKVFKSSSIRKDSLVHWGSSIFQE